MTGSSRPGDALERYRDLRLSLADALRAQLHLARARHDPVGEEAARALLARLARDGPTVAVAGQFSRGKTTLLNALLGAEHLPTGALPMTSVPTLVRYGSAPRASYRRRGSDVDVPIAVAEVPALVARQSALRSELQVVGVEIELPAELLRLGVAIVDTPGVGSTDAATSATTFGLLPDVDAVIFVTGADSALTETDLALLTRVPDAAHLFCVVNKRDLVTTDERAQVLAATADLLSARRPPGSWEVVALSALQGLRARLSLDPTADDGGLSRFQGRLASFLTRSRASLTLTAVLDRAVALASGQRALLAMADAYAGGTTTDRDAAIAAVAAAIAGAATERAAVLDRVGGTARERVAELFGAHGDAWRRELAELLDAPDESFAAWLRARAGEVTELIVGAGAPELARLSALAAAPAAAALRWSGQDAAVVDEPWDPASLPAVAPPRIARPGGGDEPRGPGRARRAAARRDDAGRVLLGGLRDRVDGQVGQWLASIAAEAQRRSDTASVRLDAYLAGPTTPEDAVALARIDADLAAIGVALAASAEPGASDGGGTADGEVGLGTDASAAETVAGHEAMCCTVCERQRDALVADLAHRQFGLATRRDDQDALARAHGLCPAHAWSYATMTSPLGMSAAYAPVAHEVARMLAAAPDRVAIARSAADLAAGPRMCPVCTTIADAERAAFEELADAGDATVCVRHLAGAARAGLDGETVLRLARRLADALERSAQDMRAYALKREALARGLLTAEERRAHREALLLLAGDPALARPLANEQERDELGFGG